MSAFDEQLVLCVICSGKMVPESCKWICHNCGYKIDCSDTF